jgi:hypothetical protein
MSQPPLPRRLPVDSMMRLSGSRHSQPVRNLIIISNAFSEGSGQPDTAIRGTWEYENDAQIIKETIGVTGSEMVNQTWFQVNTMGAKTNAYYHLGQVDIDYRTALRIDGALLFGKRTTNTTGADALIDPENRSGYQDH